MQNKKKVALGEHCLGKENIHSDAFFFSVKVKKIVEAEKTIE